MHCNARYYIKKEGAMQVVMLCKKEADMLTSFTPASLVRSRLCSSLAPTCPLLVYSSHLFGGVSRTTSPLKRLEETGCFTCLDLGSYTNPTFRLSGWGLCLQRLSV